jgi:hypothetical protein
VGWIGLDQVGQGIITSYCQRFLQFYFAVENEKAEAWGWKPIKKYEFKRKVKENENVVEKIFYPIIPIIEKSLASHE